MNEEVVTQAGKALSKARIKMMATPSMTFVTSICLGMKMVWDESIRTAQTNGLSIIFNPHFFLKLTPNQRVTLLCHETWHPALKHMVRGKTLNHLKYNKAGDYFINLMLLENGLEAIPGWLCDTAYRGMSTDQIYALLPDEPSNGGDAPDWADIIYGDGSKEDQQVLENQLDNILVRAHTQAKMVGEAAIGNLPSDVLVYIEKLLNPTLSWDKLLRKYVSSFAKQDYSWQRPNKRFLPEFYLPSLYSETLTELVLFMDLSGSVSDEDIRYFCGEVHKMFTSLKPKEITLVTFDTQIQDTYRITSANDMARKELHGRGGTCVKAVMEWIKKRKPVVSVILTDGYFYWDNVINPKAPVIWAIHNNPKFTAPFGKVVHYELNH